MSPKNWVQFEKIREDRKASILESALTLFAEEGYHGTSISKISKHAGVSKGLMYNYFESKEALLKAILTIVFEGTQETMEYWDGKEMTDESMIINIDKSFEMILKDPLHWKLYFSLVTQPVVLKMAFEFMVPKAKPFMESMVKYFEQKGHKDPLLTMQYYGSTLKGAHLQTILDPVNFPHKKVKALIIKQFIKS